MNQDDWFNTHLSGPSIDTINLNMIQCILASLEGAKFDGTDRFDSVHTFITKCDVAFSLCEDAQMKRFVLSIVKGKLAGDVLTIVANRDYNSWESLSGFLRSRYLNRANLPLSIRTLLSLNQKKSENLQAYITQFRGNFENVMRILSGDLSAAERNIQTDFLCQMALQAFIEGLNYDLGAFVEIKKPTSLENAFSIAIENSHKQFKDKKVDNKETPLSVKTLLSLNQKKYGDLQAYITQFRISFIMAENDLGKHLSHTDRNIQKNVLSQLAIQAFIVGLNDNLAVFVENKTPTNLENAFFIATVENSHKKLKDNNLHQFMNYKNGFFGISGGFFVYFKSPQFKNTASFSVVTISSRSFIKKEILHRSTAIYTDIDGITSFCTVQLITPDGTIIHQRFEITDKHRIKDDGILGCNFFTASKVIMKLRKNEEKFVYPSNTTQKVFTRDLNLYLHY